KSVPLTIGPRGFPIPEAGAGACPKKIAEHTKKTAIAEPNVIVLIRAPLYLSVGPTGQAVVGTPPFNSSRFSLPTAASLTAFGRSPHVYRTAHGAGFQPEASACFLKWAAVIIGSVRYVGSSSVDVSTRYVSPLDSLTRS